MTSAYLDSDSGSELDESEGSDVGLPSVNICSPAPKMPKLAGGEQSRSSDLLQSSLPKHLPASPVASNVSSISYSSYHLTNALLSHIASSYCRYPGHLISSQYKSGTLARLLGLGPVLSTRTHPLANYWNAMRNH